MRIFLLYIFFLFHLSLAGQEILSQPSARLVTRFPLKQYSGGVMVIRARFENIPDTLNFILDTGSGGISLDSSTCEEFHIQVTPTDTFITGIGGIKKVPFIFNKTLHLPGLDVNRLQFHVNNYEVLSSVYGEKVDGIIGYSFLSRYIVQIDFDSNEVRVFSPGKFTYPTEGTILHPVFTSIPIQWLRIRDSRRMWNNFYFDTGAGLCFLLSDRYAEDSSVLLSKRKPVYTQAEGMGGRLQMRLTVMKEIKIGPYKFRNVPTYLYKDDFNVTSYPFTGGLIGNDLLRRFNITLNYPEREIHLEPNSRFNDPFEYAYTGLGMYFIDGKIQVEDVIPTSPADKAGFKVGDEVFAVGNNFSKNIQQYKNALQMPNEVIKVVVMRDQKPVMLTIKTLSVY